MQWGGLDDVPKGESRERGRDVSVLAMPVRVEVSLTGAPWEFRARLVEAGSDYCVLTLVSPCAPAMRRGAAATLHVGTLGGGELTFDATITDLLPRPAGMTFRCAIERRGASEASVARVLSLASRVRSA